MRHIASLRPRTPRARIRLLGAAVAACLLAGGAAAQDTAGSGPRTAGRTRVLVGAGLDGFLRDGSEFTPQLALHAGYEFWRGGAGRTALRLGADYTTRRYGPTVIHFDGEPGATIDRSGRSQIFGAALLGTYALTSAGGGARPYVVGGAGLYGLTWVRREPASPVSPGGTERLSRVSPGLTGGLGVSWPITAATSFFGEARVTYLSNGVGGSEPGIRSVVVPLIVGLRF